MNRQAGSACHVEQVVDIELHSIVRIGDGCKYTRHQQAVVLKRITGSTRRFFIPFKLQFPTLY